LILLSNVLVYLDNEYEEVSIGYIVENFFNITEEDGQIDLIYTYGYKESEDNICKSKQIVEGRESTVLEFPGTINKRGAVLVLKTG